MQISNFLPIETLGGETPQHYLAQIFAENAPFYDADKSHPDARFYGADGVRRGVLSIVQHAYRSTAKLEANGVATTYRIDQDVVGTFSGYEVAVRSSILYSGAVFSGLVATEMNFYRKKSGVSQASIYSIWDSYGHAWRHVGGVQFAAESATPLWLLFPLTGDTQPSFYIDTKDRCSQFFSASAEHAWATASFLRLHNGIVLDNGLTEVPNYCLKEAYGLKSVVASSTGFSCQTVNGLRGVGETFSLVLGDPNTSDHPLNPFIGNDVRNTLIQSGPFYFDFGYKVGRSLEQKAVPVMFPFMSQFPA